MQYEGESGRTNSACNYTTPLDTSHRFDRYRRILAVCSLSGSDVNAWMVRQGWALAYGYAGTYHAQQDEAQAARRGIWAGAFVPPAEWRKRH